MVPGRLSASILATLNICSSLTPQASSTLSGVHLAMTRRAPFHAADTVVDVLLVFPAVLEDVIDQAEQEGEMSVPERMRTYFRRPWQRCG